MESTEKVELHADLSKYIFGKSRLECGFSPCPCLSGPLSQSHTLECPPTIKGQEVALKTEVANASCMSSEI